MRLRRWFLWDETSLVAVKSWWPIVEWDPIRKRVEVLGPLLLTDRGGRRQSERAVWNWAHIISPWRKD
jgi:hypothetical protein